MLRHHAVAAYPALRGDAEPTRVQLRAALTAAYPRSDAAYLFWTQREDQTHITATGDLAAALTVHIDGPGVATAARTVLESVGFTVTGPTPDTLSVAPASPS